MHLEIDVGNSRCKWRIVESSKVEQVGCFDYSAVPHSWGLPEVKPTRIKAAAVVDGLVKDRLKSELFARYGCEIEWAKSAATCSGVTNAYCRPETLGVDRWLALVAAYKRYGECLVIDAGSALTVDAVSECGQHLGGYIAPGVSSMAASLLKDTAKVHFEQSSVFFDRGFGKDTGSCVNGALRAAQLGVVKEAISQANSQLSNSYTIVVTGGYALEIAVSVERHVEICPELVLDGLQWVLP